MTRRRVVFLLVLLVVSVSACSRAPETPLPPTLTPQFGTAETDKASEVSVSPSGALYVAGDFRNRSFLRRYSPSGALLWQRTLNRSTNLFYDAHFVATDSRSNAYVAVSGPEASEANLAKYSPNGTQLWSKRQKNIIYGIAADSSGNLFVASGGKGYLTKYSPSGRKLWERWGFPAPLAVSVSAKGNVFLAREDGMVLKYAGDGRRVWRKQIDFTRGFSEYALEHLELTVGKNEEVYVLTRLLAELYFGGEDTVPDAYLRLHAFGASGNAHWTRTVMHLGNPCCYQGGVSYGTPNAGLTTDGGGNVLLAYPGPSSRDRRDVNAYLAKYSRSGSRLWRREFGTPDTDGALSVAAYGTSALYVAGYSYADLGAGNKGFADAFLKKLDAQGRTLWTR